MSTIKNQLKEYLLNECLVDGITLTELFEKFDVQYNCEYEKKRTPNLTARFADWLKGLPSCIDIPYTHYGISELIKSFKPDVIEQTLRRYDNYFFEICAFILVQEFNTTK